MFRCFDDIIIPKKHFDLSNMQRRKFQDDIHKKVLGNFKDELNGKILTEILALKPNV